MRLRFQPLSRPTSRNILKSKSRGYGRAHCYQKAWAASTESAVLESRGCALGCFGRCEPLGKAPSTLDWPQPVVGGARSAHDERLVTRFPPVVWPFNPSIFDAPPTGSFRPAATGAGPAPFGAPWAVICLRICSLTCRNGMMASRRLWPGSSPALPALRKPC